MLPGKNNFRFFIPINEIKKGKDAKGKETMVFAGIASTKRRDTDGEILNPNGFDISYLKERGIVNWNHDKAPNSIIGEPSLAEIRKAGLYVESTLYSKSKKAKQVYQLAQDMKESGANRSLGYSVEGKAIERDPTDPSHVTKAMITGVAITISPKNPDSIIDIIKGDYSGWDDDEKPPVVEDADIDEILKSIDVNIVDITRPDGKRIVVDSKYNIKIQKGEEATDEEEEDEEKALTTTSGAAVIPEHVDGETKTMLNGKPQPTSINKSENETFLTEEEVICRIMKSNSVITFLQAEEILKNLNTLTMSKTGKTTNISDDLLEKSLAKLGFKKEQAISKGEKGGEEEDDDDEAEEDATEGGKEPKGKNKKPGLKKGAAISKKYKNEDEDDDEEDPEEEDRDKEDDEDEEVEEPMKRKKSVKKAVRSTLRKSNTREIAAQYDDEVLGELSDNVGELKDMVKSLAVIVKHGYDLAKSQQDELGELKETIAAFGDAPVSAGRKSVTVKKAADREFQKGMGGDDTLEKAENGAVVVDVDRCRNQVLNMFDALTFAKGVYNEEMGNGMRLFEASGMIHGNLQKALENEFKVKLIRNK